MTCATAYQGSLGSIEARWFDERSIVDAAQDGCVESFTLLVERHHAQILRYLLRQTGDRELAADLTQETFLDAYRRLGRLADDRPFAPWLYRIAHYNLLHELRRQRIRRMLSLDWLIGEGGEAWRPLHQSDETGSSHERDLIQEVLNTLTPTLRVPLLLYCLDGFSGQEVAEILGISPAAARQRIARAKDQFRQQYQAFNADTQAAALAACCLPVASGYENIRSSSV